MEEMNLVSALIEDDVEDLDVEWGNDQEGEQKLLTGSEKLPENLQAIEDAHVPDGTAKRVAKAFQRLRRRALAPYLEGRGMLVCGESGTGKSHALEQLSLAKDLQPFETKEGLMRPFLLVSAPMPCTLKTLGRQIFLDMTGIELRSRVLEHEIWSRVRAHLKAQKTKFLVIDEMQHVLRGRAVEEHDKVAETFKTIMQMKEWPVYLVLGGMPESMPFVQSHPQLNRRIKKITIRPVDKGKVGLKAIVIYTQDLLNELNINVDFDLSETAPRLHVASDGYLGKIALIVKQAAEDVILDEANTIGLEDLAEAFTDIYAADDKEIEDAKNPFLAVDYSEIVVPKLQTGRGTNIKGKKS